MQKLTSLADLSKEIVFNHYDIIDIDNGKMEVWKENINKYLEKYSCKNEEELSDVLYYKLGIMLKIKEENRNER